MTAPTNPPQVVVAEKAPHRIWGICPIGEGECTLDIQPIAILDHWHKKTTALMDAFSTTDFSKEADDEYDALHSIQRQIFLAAFKTDLNSSSCVSRLMKLTVRQCEHNSSTPSLEQFKVISDALAVTTAFPEATKNVGPLSRGKKLTRAGLLYRYHAFLIGELHTLGWSFYGSRDYPTLMVPIDDAVTVRTSNDFKDGKPLNYSRKRKLFPFFDETKLVARARSVLKSLKIDTEKKDVR
ncbi:hypothetical protein [Tardiphaga sp. 841_E9_N1_2]|uniref:hypothetical protein n=1 Tax=Tardiphaga sp. 841_E9_N1_2 TaxID=3240762 RepID=UPI003F25762A